MFASTTMSSQDKHATERCIWEQLTSTSAAALHTVKLILVHISHQSTATSHLGGGTTFMLGFHEELHTVAMIGTSDQPCCLAAACIILLLSLGVQHAVGHPA